MMTQHALLPTTAPGYASSSGLILEVKMEGAEHWSLLKTAEPYKRNREVSVREQISSLEIFRDQWRANGPKKYFGAEYRIGSYKTDRGGYVYYPAHVILAELAIG